jgi:hypothetical protein
LTHVELLYRPGERETAIKVLTLLGCEPVDRGGTWFTAFIAPPADGPRDYGTNVFYASQVRPAQWDFEQSLGTLPASGRQAYLDFLRREPQQAAHFGFRVGERATLDAIIARVTEASRNDPELAGRVAVDGVFEPDAPGAIANTMVQAFIWTDVVASGLLTLGQHIEVQWHLPA